ncbi:MAG: hypothetical protein ACOYKJ_04860 [Candidatus Howiella sp.]|jgi:hypothetical protein
MLRGVNRSIVEVAGSGSRYFEKAILFVRPECAGFSAGRLEAGAREYLESLESGGGLPLPRPRESRRTVALRRRRILLRMALGVAVVAALVGYTVFVRSL